MTRESHRSRRPSGCDCGSRHSAALPLGTDHGASNSAWTSAGSRGREGGPFGLAGVVQIGAKGIAPPDSAAGLIAYVQSNPLKLHIFPLKTKSYLEDAVSGGSTMDGDGWRLWSCAA
ncbi:hypothetical protein GE21DRAFT_1952 [Neurospora crassa]|uniref:Uncharacterized protein n=2 Tax=Neurospora crassa TaxID=5141 RepID=Q7SDR3_NEUCR|nr:hypothetical protein NCU00760 [Neurospora crassa OR74A]EAA34921.1 hypothetical protein NCU00760 [Neurospora crassa OR74A]KHE83695.1 hypothetical protein GE21DRAFT_1952 [Neurospora crassa]CAE81957.1 hypothetical protein [Neurospora crassa]|eukprot:XP_964157.1 hypothetical protein NCU00760 [Neurospora crassa OR74A]